MSESSVKLPKAAAYERVLARELDSTEAGEIVGGNTECL